MNYTDEIEMILDVVLSALHEEVFLDDHFNKVIVLHHNITVKLSVEKLIKAKLYKNIT